MSEYIKIVSRMLDETKDRLIDAGLFDAALGARWHEAADALRRISAELQQAGFHQTLNLPEHYRPEDRLSQEVIDKIIKKCVSGRFGPPKV